MPAAAAPAPSASGTGISATAASVVNNKATTEAAFCKAERVTLVGPLNRQEYLETAIE